MSIQKKILLILAVITAVSAALCLCAYAEEYDGYIVQFKENVITEANREGKISLCSVVPNMKEVRADKNIFKIEKKSDIQGLADLGLIESLEPNYIYTLDYTPTDPYYTSRYQPNMWQVGAEYAWEMGCYGNGVKIGIIDSGIYDHDDLKGALAGGVNVINEAESYYDTYGHGTVVAGIIGAQFNDIQCAGIAPKAELYAIKCFVGKDTALEYLIKGVYAAVDDFDCDVINMSLSGPTTDGMKKAVKYALDKNKIVCAAVGNEGTSQINYPAAYDGVIGVGSVDSSNNHSYFSNTNKSVFVCAPGQLVKVLTFDGAEKMNLGTSFSCPHVSAAAAIAKNIKPDITPQEFAEAVKTSAIDRGDDGYDETFGYGLLNIDGIIGKLLENKTFYVSPITVWSDEDVRYTLYNNTLSAVSYIKLMKSDTDKTFDFESLNAKTTKEIQTEYKNKNSSIYIINKADLRPLASALFKGIIN